MKSEANSRRHSKKSANVEGERGISDRPTMVKSETNSTGETKKNWATKEEKNLQMLKEKEVFQLSYNSEIRS